MDKIIDQLYQMELEADKTLDTVNEKKIDLKNKYDDKRVEYQKKAERKFDEQTMHIKESYETEKKDQLKIVENEFESSLEQIRKVLNHEQEHYVEMFMNEVKKLGVKDDE